MRKLFVPFLDQYTADDDIETVSAMLDALPENKIDHQPWPEFKTHVHANFSIAHSNEAVLLKYKVTEESLKVSTFETNGKVHKDNCVEFFISFGTDKAYYNIEMNCIGIGLIAYGKGRLNRKFLPKQLVEKIKTYIKIKTLPEDKLVNYSWEITLIIPISVFAQSDLQTLKNETGNGNFFKCGDDLPQPHFLSWNKIEAGKPDFHLPEFFGALTFE